MTKIKITARDSSTAMEEVSKKLGTDAFILSTSSTEGGVEIEATNDPAELKKFSEKPKKKFSNLMKKQLNNVAEFPLPQPTHRNMNAVLDYTELKSNPVDSDLSVLNQSVRKLTEEIRGMYITEAGGLGIEIGESSFVKLQQAGFETSVIKALSPSFNGLNFERGRAAFMAALAKSLTVPIEENTLKRVTFVNGFSGVGKTTLTAKISATHQEKQSENITMAALGYRSDSTDDMLRSNGRLLNTPVLRLNPTNLVETLCATKGKILVDVSIEPQDALPLIRKSLDFLDENEVTSIVAIPGGSSRKFINGQAELFKECKPELTLTKLDECDLTSSEMSEFFLNSMKIYYLTGSKSILGGLSVCNADILTQYLIENC